MGRSEFNPGVQDETMKKLKQTCRGSLALHGVLLLLALASTAIAQVHFTREADVVHVGINGKPFADFHFSADVAKPYLEPLHAASGTIVTRRFPMVEGLGETTDHRHHRGLWVGYIDVNGVNYWENEFSYKNPKAGKIVAVKVDDSAAGALRLTANWIDPSDKTVLVEDRTMTFGGDDATRTIDIDFTLTAKEKCVFGDDKDGVFGIRLADPLNEKNSGTITSSAGLTHMADVWGKHADWIDYSGEIKGEKLGLAIFDHPSSFRHPSRWHSRDYGLFAVNPFGSQAFDKTAEKSEVVLNPGEKLHFRYLVVIHEQMSIEKIGQMYKTWSAKK
jgi:Family of unknown function (DUF6807)